MALSPLRHNILTKLQPLAAIHGARHLQVFVKAWPVSAVQC